MKSALLLILICLTAKAGALGQGVCNLDPHQSPPIRGFRLGMTINQIQELIPATQNDNKVVEALERARLEPLPTLLTIQLNSSDSRYKTMRMFENINYILLRFFTNQLVEISVQYDWPRWNNADEFIAKLREGFVLLEGKEWQGNNGTKVLRCKDFRIAVHAPFNSGAMVNIIDTTFAKKMDDLQQSILEKARKEFKP